MRQHGTDLAPAVRALRNVGALLSVALLAATIALAVAWPGLVDVQKEAQAQTAPKDQLQQPEQQQPPARPQAPSVQPQPSSEWARLPRMQLERQYAGPLQDTVVQRWRDGIDGSICYIYLPITAAHSPPVANGFVQYGANTIGSVSCFAASATVSTGRSAAAGSGKSPTTTP
jgi:hypothetical protein